MESCFCTHHRRKAFLPSVKTNIFKRFLFGAATGSLWIIQGDKEKYRNIWNLDITFYNECARCRYMEDELLDKKPPKFLCFLAARQRLVCFNPGLNYIPLIKFFCLVNIASENEWMRNHPFYLRIAGYESVLMRWHW